MDKGLWFARSQEFLQAPAFQTMTWLRIVGGSIFLLGGVVPLTWFVLGQIRHLKPSAMPVLAGEIASSEVKQSAEELPTA
jgi:nitric oxide reductase subunit B